jgi:dihydrofolate reductase
MRASVFCGVSLDGFIARENGDLDWLMGNGPPDDHGYNDFVSTIDSLVIGRKTYETVLGFGGWAYGEMPVIVLSSSELEKLPEGGNVERMSGDPVDIFNELESRGLDHLYIDGGLTIQGFLRAGLIDRMIISRLPVLIGNGIPLFGETGSDIRWKLERVKEFPSGMVQCEYSRLH